MSRFAPLALVLAFLALPSSLGFATSTPGGALFDPLPADARKLVVVTTVVEIGGGAAVLLTEPTSGKVLPIFIGPSEAMAIALRLEGVPFARPLTHDLLDTVMHHLGGSVVAVEVSSLEEQIFLAVLTLRKPDGTLVRLDARPSDSIALALAARAPVYVAHKVLDAAAVDPPNQSDGGKGAPL